MKVTADTITDEQIETMRTNASENGEGVAFDGAYISTAAMLNLCDEARGELGYGDMEVTDEWVADRIRRARALCAEIWNDSHATEQTK